MKEIILEKRYPHSREEDITDAFMRGYEIGKEQEHRWWSAFCANCKTENSSEIPNNSTISKMEQVDRDINVRSKDEPQTETEIAKAIVHKMIDNSVIAEDAYPDLRQRMHEAVERLDEYYPSEDGRSE